MSHVPVRFKYKNINAGIVIPNTKEDCDAIKEKLCVLTKTPNGKGKVFFGDVGTDKECLAYNRGYEDGFASRNDVIQIDAPDLKTKDGTVITRGPKKRIKN